MDAVDGNSWGVLLEKNSVLSCNQQLHLFLSKHLLEELNGKKCVGGVCARESDAPDWAH